MSSENNIKSQLCYLVVAPVNCLPLLGQDLLNVGLPLEVRPPVQVVRDQVQVVTALAPHYHHPLGVRLLADNLLVLGVANFACVGEEHLGRVNSPKWLLVTDGAIALGGSTL